MSVCDNPDCTRDIGRHGARGLCNTHYQQARRDDDISVIAHDPYSLDRLATEIRQPMGAWADQAACLDADPDAFFPEGKGDHRYVAHAKRICDGCPVAAPCLGYAIANDITDGVFGGMAPRERQRYARRAA